MWDKAFLVQARSDWEIFRLLDSQRFCERCHCLHYLQMSTEKLAKAIMSRQHGGAKAPRKHHVFVQMLRSSRKAPRRFATALGVTDHQYIEIVKQILP